jgi:hypothetical protein
MFHRQATCEMKITLDHKDVAPFASNKGFPQLIVAHNILQSLTKDLE